MNKISLFLVLLLGSSTVFAKNISEITYDCDTIISECTNPDNRVCHSGQYEKDYIDDIKQECENIGDGKLSIENVREARFIAWLLLLKLDEAVYLDASIPDQERQIRTVLDITVQAIAPIPDEKSVKKRFNNLVSDR